jgi:hypothetical protein
LPLSKTAKSAIKSNRFFFYILLFVSTPFLGHLYISSLHLIRYFFVIYFFTADSQLFFNHIVYFFIHSCREFSSEYSYIRKKQNILMEKIKKSKIKYSSYISPYHVQHVKFLQPGDCRHTFCECMLDKINRQPDFLNNVSSTEEVGFTRTGIFNVHNITYYSVNIKFGTKFIIT